MMTYRLKDGAMLVPEDELEDELLTTLYCACKVGTVCLLPSADAWVLKQAPSSMQEERLADALALIEAQDKLLACYRLGTRPADKLLNKMAVLRARIDEYTK